MDTDKDLKMKLLGKKTRIKNTEYYTGTKRSAVVYFAVLLDKVDARVDQPFEQINDVLFIVVGHQNLRQGIEPRPEQRAPA
jgi:hypothetical protein